MTNETRLKLQNLHLLELSKFIGGEGEWDYEQAAKLIIQAAIDGLQTSRASIWNLNHTIDAMECIALFSDGDFSPIEGFVLHAANYPLYFNALKEERFIVAHDAHTHHDTAEFSAGYLTPLKIFSLLDAPIRKDGKIVGILCCEQTGAPRQWGSVEQSFAGMLADSAGRALTEHERKASLRELKLLNENLEFLVESRTHDLEQTLQSLQQTQAQLIENEKMASLGNLVAGVAHEINTPVGISVTAASHFHDTLMPLTKAFESKTLTASMLQNTLQTLSEIDTILGNNLFKASQLIQSFKKIAVNQSNEAILDINLNELLHDVVNSLTHQLKLQRTSLVITCDKEIRVTTYAGALSQTITNLIMNSLTHAFEDTHITPTISITATLNEATVVLRYSDNGVGMDETTVKKAFEPFFTTKRGLGGSGLGLHVVYNVVTQQLHGNIKLSSTPLNGVLFTLTFPRVLS